MASQGFGGSKRRQQRKFQATNFGCDRDENSLPPWKQRMMSRLLTSSRRNRASLIKKLKQNGTTNQNVSPKSKKTQANQTIDSFKRAIVDNDKDNAQWTNVSKKDYEDIMQMLDTEFYNGIRSQVEEMLASEQEMLFNDQETSFMNELDLEKQFNNNNNNNNSNNNKSSNDNSNNCNSNSSFCDNGIVCPICNNDFIQVEDIEIESKENNSLKIKIYQCPTLTCHAQWQASESVLRRPMKINTNNNIGYETDFEHAQRLFKSLKNTLNNICLFHQSSHKCNTKLNFAVESETKFLQAWCNRCKFNSLL